MLFNSLDFLVFFVLVYGLYLALPHRGQNTLLLAASYIFYGWWDWRFLALILFSTAVDYVTALGIAGSSSDRRRRMFLVLSVVVNLAVLGFFKYFNFFVGSAFDLLHVFGLDPHRLRLNIILPVGISFYTFQSMSYSIDVYRGQLKPTRNFFDYALFVSFFPQLVAGPVERASHLLPQVLQPRTVTWQKVQQGVWLFFWGLFLKAVVADNLATLVDEAFADPSKFPAASVLVSMYAFMVQIYADFNGYSSMARGLASLMGFDIMINFWNPFFALNPVDFWRRWHISLSQWFQDYLYFPLAVHYMRKGAGFLNRYKAHFIAMTLIGLWHGANWTYVLFGMFWGVAIIVYNHVHQHADPRRRASSSPMRRALRPEAPLGKILRIVAMWHVICIADTMFRATSVTHFAQMVGRLFRAGSVHFATVAGLPLDTLNRLAAVLVLCAPVALVDFLQERGGHAHAPLRLSLLPRAALYAVLLLMLLAFANTGAKPFIYFQF